MKTEISDHLLWFNCMSLDAQRKLMQTYGGYGRTIKDIYEIVHATEKIQELTKICAGHGYTINDIYKLMHDTK